MERNQISGKLPLDIAAMEDLLELDMESNEFEGDLPDLPPNLELFNCKSNKLTKLPDNMDKLANIQEFDASNNLFVGPLDPNVGNMGFSENSLERLDLSGNSFSGAIPEELGDLIGLTFLDLSNNQFDGNPEAVGNLINLGKTCNYIYIVCTCVWNCKC